MRRLLTQVPDPVSLDDLVTLPDWCVLVTTYGDDFPWMGDLWMHLEHDHNTGRPELRILLDTGFEGPETLPFMSVYLNRPTVTEAVADAIATAQATLEDLTGVRTGVDVQGAPVTVEAVQLAERVERWVAIAAYLARPEADICELGRPTVRPSGERKRRPPKKDTIWLVGYGQSFAESTPKMG